MILMLLLGNTVLPAWLGFCVDVRSSASAAPPILLLVFVERLLFSWVDLNCCVGGICKIV